MVIRLKRQCGLSAVEYIHCVPLLVTNNQSAEFLFFLIFIFLFIIIMMIISFFFVCNIYKPICVVETAFWGTEFVFVVFF